MDAVTPTGTTFESAETRLARLLRSEPLLRTWVAEGTLSDAEAELVWLLVDGAEQGRAMRVACPGRGARVATLGAVALSIRRLTNPGTRQPLGPIALIGAGPTHRQLLAELSVRQTDIVGSLGIVRLRRDGLVQRLRSGTPSPVEAGDHLVLVSDRVGLPETAPFGPVVIDETGSGNAYERLHEWALDRSALVHLVAPLRPSAGAAGFVADWPLIFRQPGRWPHTYTGAWGLNPSTTVYPVTPEPVGLASARARVAKAAQDLSAGWPDPLRNAAALSRQLATIAVPIEHYDSQTRGTIAVPIAERAEQLRGTKPSDLPPSWRSFAETAWAPLKQDLLGALDQLENFNPKSEAMGLVVEALLREGATVEIWVDNGVHARALAKYLATAGFSITPEHLDSGRLVVKTFGDRIREGAAGVAVVCGLPASWQLDRVVSSDFGAPLHVIAYPFEENRVGRALGWALNGSRLDHDAERRVVLRLLLGDVNYALVPEPVPNVTMSSETLVGAEDPLRESGTDVAEFAALADDEWLTVLVGDRRDESERPARSISVCALLVEPGPAVILVPPALPLDRMIGGRVRPTPCVALAAGMTILGLGADGRSLFDRLRPYLDTIHGPGTRFWLEQWEDALREAADKVGGPRALADALSSLGAVITSGAVASWASPYRIGPRDPANVSRVAGLASHILVSHHALRVAAVMRGVRIEHHRLGRSLVRAIRRHAAGDIEAFDAIEEHLGVTVSSIIGDLDTYTILQALGPGTAPAAATRRLLSLSEARELFRPEDPAT